MNLKKCLTRAFVVCLVSESYSAFGTKYFTLLAVNGSWSWIFLWLSADDRVLFTGFDILGIMCHQLKIIFYMIVSSRNLQFAILIDSDCMQVVGFLYATVSKCDCSTNLKFGDLWIVLTILTHGYELLMILGSSNKSLEREIPIKWLMTNQLSPWHSCLINQREAIDPLFSDLNFYAIWEKRIFLCALPLSYCYYIMVIIN